MTNISSVWQIGNTTFNAIEFDEDTTLATIHAKFIGERGSFVSQEVSGATLRVKAYSKNLSSLIQELHSTDKLKLQRYDGYVQYVEFDRRNSRLEAPILHNKEMDLEFIATDPYKYSSIENSTSFKLNDTETEITLNVDGEVKTPLEFAINSYRLASAIKSFSSTGKSYSVTGYSVIKASECDIKALRSIPNADWFDMNGLLFPSYKNESGWKWQELNIGQKKLLDYADSQVFWNRIPVSKPYVANFIAVKSTGAVDRDIILKIHYLQLYITYGREYIFDRIRKSNGWSLSVWNSNLSEWRVIQTNIQNFGDAQFIHLNNYDGNPILIGYKNTLQYDYDYHKSHLAFNQFQIGLRGFSLVSVIQKPDTDYFAPLEVKIAGSQNFNGKMYINIYPATIIDVNNRSFYPNIILESFTIDGNNWSNTHTFRFNPSGYDTFAIELNPNYNGTIPKVNIYNTSTAGDGLIFYEKTIAGEQIFNVTHSYETIVKQIKYKTPVKNFKIRSLLDRSTELVFNGAFVGEIGHYNDSNYYRFNPFQYKQVDSCILEKSSGAEVNASQIVLDSSEWVQFGLYSLVPFANIPEGHWNGTGNISAYITLNSTSDVNYMYDVLFVNSPYKFPLYNNECILLGKSHFFLHLIATTSTTITNIDIQAPVSFANKGFVYLYPNKENKIFISYDNLNSNASIRLTWRNAYL